MAQAKTTTTKKLAPKKLISNVKSTEKVEDDILDEVSEDIPVIDKAVEKSKSEETVEEVSKEPNVRVKPNKDIRTFIGDQWYNLPEGKVSTVPKTVKDILQRAGKLSPL